MFSTGNQTVDVVGNLKFTGNTIPDPWYKNIRLDNGKLDTISILILADIVYWYRPSYIHDEETGLLIGIKKKFKSDLLQRSYKGFEEKFGFTEKQTREALKRLENIGVVQRVFRTIETPSLGKVNNVMFIALNPYKLAEISMVSDGSDLFPFKETGGSQSGPGETGGSLKGNKVVPQKETASDLKGTTNTKSTTKTTTEIKTHYREFVSLTPKEYDVLNEKYGKQQTEDMLDMLDNYKGANGKTYKSDYRAVLSWVVTRYNETKKGKNGNNIPKAYQSMQDWLGERE
jgi:hypothetical protein